MKTKRVDVYALISGEREYQESRWPGHKHSVGDFLTYMHHWLAEAIKVDATTDAADQEHFVFCCGAIRKFAALGVACLEQNTDESRRGFIYFQLDDMLDSHGISDHSTSEFLTLLRVQLRCAEEAWLTSVTELSVLVDAMAQLMVLAAMGVVFLEQHGAPAR